MKTTSQIIRESMDAISTMTEAPKRYDFTYTIENPIPPTPEQDAAEARGEDSDYEIEFDIGINYSISGRYIPAKITADPGTSHPAEHPELEMLEIFRLDTGEDITDQVPEEVKERLGQKAWEDADAKSEANAYDDRDRYDPY